MLPPASHSGRRASLERKQRTAEAVGLCVLLAGLVSVPLYIVAETAIGAALERADWDIDGPPCPVVQQPSRLARGSRPPKEHVYGPVRFVRSFGAVSCAAFREPRVFSDPPPYRVCQFNNPGAVTVVTSGETVTFEGPAGRRLTVTVRDGHARCVVGGWFNV